MEAKENQDSEEIMNAGCFMMTGIAGLFILLLLWGAFEFIVWIINN